MDVNNLKLKTYVESEYRSAYAKARKELGTDLFLIDKKEVKEGGILGFFGKKRIKFTFGIENKPKRQSNKEIDILKALKEVAKKHVDTTTDNKEILSELKKPEMESELDAGVYSPFKKPAIKPMEKIKSELGVNLDNKIQVDIEKAIEEELQKELNKNNIIANQMINNDEKEAFIERLRDNDIPKDIALEINDYFDKFGYDKVNLKEGLSQYFKDNIKIKNGIDKKFLMLIGPTGVGKTTTCAKIVANNWREEKEVGFITADTYRLEAVSQLKAYANIMRVPVEVVKTPNDLQNSIKRFKNKDLVLMDTAGRSPKNKKQMEELKNYVESEGSDMEVTLVITATSKLSVIYETIDKFSEIGFSSIIITKIDETSNASLLLPIMKKYNYPICYLTTGQTVPDDIETCTVDKVTEIFIEGIK